MSTSPFVHLLTAASDTNSDTERLLRAVVLVAGAQGDATTREWATKELKGYEGVDVPEYRQAPAMLMATDPYGRNQPVHLQDASARAKAGRCALVAPLADVIRCAAAPEGNSFQVSFLPQFEAKLLKSLPGATTAFRVVQRSAFASAVAAVRQKVFEWALGRVQEHPQLPHGIDIPAMLGLPHINASHAAQPVEGRSGVDMSNAQFTGPVQIVQSSPGVSATQTHNAAPDMAALRELVQELSKVVAAASAADGSGVQLKPALAELQELAAMPAPRAGWLKESLKSLRTVVEGATGAVVSELAKPHVQALLAQALARWS